MVQTRDGGYALAGSTESPDGRDDFWLVKTDSGGREEWNRTFGGANQDWALSLIQDRDKGYLLAGYTASYGAGAGDFWLVKTNTTGGMEWNMTCGGPGWDSARAVIQTRDGGYAVAGLTRSFGSGGFWLVKISPENKAFPVWPIVGIGVISAVTFCVIYAKKIRVS